MLKTGIFNRLRYNTTYMNETLDQTPGTNVTSKKRWIFWGKLFVFVLVIAWVGWELYKTADQIVSFPWKIQWGWVLLSCLIYFIAYLPPWIYWHVCLKTFGQKPHLLNTFKAYYIGHLGKYVPGKAMVVGLRAGMVQTQHVKLSIAIASVFLETLTMMAVGAMISAILLVCFFRDQTLLMLIAVGLMLASGLPVIPQVFRRLAILAGVGKNSPEIREHLNRFGFQTLLLGWILMSVTWFLLGISLWAIINGIGVEPGGLIETLPRFVAAMSLSTVGGFLSMIPGGLGVRELILAGIMGNYLRMLALPVGLTAEAAGLVIAGLTRLVSILTELFVSSLFFFIRKR